MMVLLLQVLQVMQEFDQATLRLSNREQTLQLVLAQLRDIPGFTGSTPGNASELNNSSSNFDASQEQQQEVQLLSWSGSGSPTGARYHSPDMRPTGSRKTYQRQRQEQQQQQGQHQQPAWHDRLISGGRDHQSPPSTASKLAQQAIVAARRRSTLDQEQTQQRQPGGDYVGQVAWTHSRQAGDSEIAAKTSVAMERLQEVQQRRWQSGQQHLDPAQQHHQEQIHNLLVAAVSSLRRQFVDLQEKLTEALNMHSRLQQQLTEAHSTADSSRDGVVRLRQQLAEARRQQDQLMLKLDQAEEDKQTLYMECQRLSRDLHGREQSLKQLQVSWSG